jgi:hypothetical protein
MKADSFAGRTPLPSISYRDRSARVGAAPPRAGGRPIVLARPRPGPRAAPARRASPATPLPLRPPPAGRVRATSPTRSTGAVRPLGRGVRGRAYGRGQALEARPARTAARAVRTGRQHQGCGCLTDELASSAFPEPAPAYEVTPCCCDNLTVMLEQVTSADTPCRCALLSVLNEHGLIERTVPGCVHDPLAASELCALAGSCDAALNFRETADFTQPRFSSPVVSLVLLVVLHARINLAHTARASLRKLRRHPRRNPRVSMAHHLDDCIRRAPSFLRRRRVNIIFSARPSSSVSNPPPPATPTSGGRPQPN